MDWINIWGLLVMVLMLIPNMIYAYKNRQLENKCTNKVMNIIEQIGRYGTMFLMIFNIGVYEPGYSELSFVAWIISIAVLLVLYWAFWFFYFKADTLLYALALAVIPSIIFILSGFLLRHGLLIIFGVIFAVGHIYVTLQNNRGK